MISNTDSIRLIYFTKHMRVKVYKRLGARQRFQTAYGEHRLMRFWRVRFRRLRAPAASACRGTRAAANFPASLSPLAASFLRCAPGRFLLRRKDGVWACIDWLEEHGIQPQTIRGMEQMRTAPRCGPAGLSGLVEWLRHGSARRGSLREFSLAVSAKPG
jgi:hypothetical protein